MNDLLKEAIADAKAVRQTAMANAKLALEEAFTPRIQSMLSAKLAEEEDEYGDDIQAEDDSFEGDGTPDEGPAIDDVEEQSDSSDIGVGTSVDVATGDDEEDPGAGELTEDEFESEEEVEVAPEPEAPVEEEDDLELDEIIRELEGEMEGETEPEPEPEPEAPVEEQEEEDDIDITEIIKALREEDEEEYVEESEDGYEGESKELDDLKEEEGDEEEPSPEVAEAYNVIRFLKSKINEVNLLNAKLLFSNKLFRNYNLNESQKLKVIENFDRAGNLREVKLVFATLCESFNFKGKSRLRESYASKATRSTRPKKKILSEGNHLAKRWKKLAFGK